MNKDNCPLISVIVASYNNGLFIETMIRSILKQSYLNWELIITDDCSPDNSNVIIEKYLDNPRIKLYKHQQNRGVGAAFRTCTDNAKGTIVAMLGADDALKPNALQTIVEKHLEYPDASMIIGGLELVDSALTPKNQQLVFPGFPAGVESVLENKGATGWDTFKLDKYRQTTGVDVNLKRAVDQDLYYKLEEVGEIIFIDDCLYLYRENPNGVSQGINGLIAYQYNCTAMLNAYKRRKSNKTVKNISVSQKNQILSHYYFQEAINCLGKHGLKGMSSIIKAILFSPKRLFRRDTFAITFRLLFPKPQ